MPQSSLDLKYEDLAAEVGHFLGFGRGVLFDEKAWTASQTKSIETCIKSGYRKFLLPPPVGNETSYNWSFLHPVTDLALESGSRIIPLPYDFGGLEGDAILASGSGSTRWRPLRIEPEGRLLQAYADFEDAPTGPPISVALQAIKGTTESRGQRWQLLVYPQADQAYTIQVPYYFVPEALSEPRPYALGGPNHAETILEACLSVAEQRLDDAASIHSALFMERLAASISLDRRNKPNFLGYNRDRSDERHGVRRYRSHYNEFTVTYNGSDF